MVRNTMMKTELIQQDLVFALMKQKYDLKRDREGKVQDGMKIRKEIYNLSTKINELETRLDTMLIKYMGEKK